MRKVTIAIAALGVLFAGVSIASADYNGGGPIKKGKQCWMATNPLDHGYWATCPKPMKKMGMMKKAAKKKA